jgi:hypothetical protein
MVLGFVLFGAVVRPIVGESTNPLLDVPYSPLFWGTGLVLGFLMGNLTRSASARWVWIVGVSWLAWLLIGELVHYDPRWSYGMSRAEVVWYSYFSASNNKCTQECLGKLFAVTPMFNCVAYSVGAAIGLRFKPILEPGRP